MYLCKYVLTYYMQFKVNSVESNPPYMQIAPHFAQHKARL